MWKMFPTMQSRWLGPHLLSHRSVLCIPADAFQNQRTILLGATEKGNTREKKWTSLCNHTETSVACPSLATCLVQGLPRNPKPGPKSWRKSKRSGRPWDCQSRPAFCCALHCDGHVEVALWQRGKGRAWPNSEPCEMMGAVTTSCASYVSVD